MNNPLPPSFSFPYPPFTALAPSITPHQPLIHTLISLIYSFIQLSYLLINVPFNVWVTLSLMGYVTPLTLFMFLFYFPPFLFIINQLI
jgi:hypothetical protein